MTFRAAPPTFRWALGPRHVLLGLGARALKGDQKSRAAHGGAAPSMVLSGGNGAQARKRREDRVLVEI